MMSTRGLIAHTSNSLRVLQFNAAVWPPQTSVAAAMGSADTGSQLLGIGRRAGEFDDRRKLEEKPCHGHRAGRAHLCIMTDILQKMSSLDAWIHENFRKARSSAVIRSGRSDVSVHDTKNSLTAALADIRNRSQPSEKRLMFVEP